MPRLPIVGSDDGQWGNVLNDFLSQSHKNDGTLKNDVISSAQLATKSVSSDTLTAPNGANGQILVKDDQVSGGLKWEAPQTILPSGASGSAGGDLAGTYPNPSVPGLTQKANSSDVYTKADIDNKLAQYPVWVDAVTGNEARPSSAFVCWKTSTGTNVVNALSTDLIFYIDSASPTPSYSTKHSIYSSSNPGASAIDNEPQIIKVASSFYRLTSTTDGWRVIGGRLYVDPSLLSSLPATATVFVFYAPFGEQSSLSTRVFSESKTINLAAGWNEFYWTSPYAIAVGGSERAWIGYTFGTTQYLKQSSPSNSPIAASDGSPIKFADAFEAGVARSAYVSGSTDGGSANTYCIDVIFDEGAP